MKPDFKTIADFRKDNGPAIRKVCQQFVALCRNMNLLDGDVVAIDGSRFKALNSKAKNYTRGKLRQKLVRLTRQSSAIWVSWIAPTKCLNRPARCCQRPAWNAL